MYETTIQLGGNRDLRRAERQIATADPSMILPGAPPRPSSFLAATQCELESAIKELFQLNERLGALADRVFGPAAETVAGAPTPTQPSAAGVDGIEQRVNAIHRLVQQAHFTAARLESL